MCGQPTAASNSTKKLSAMMRPYYVSMFYELYRG